MKLALLLLASGVLVLLESFLRDVMKESRESPEELVMQQIGAGNNHDTKAFARTYADTVALYRFPNTLLQKFSSNAELAEYYATFFRENPQVHCEVTGKLVRGNTIVLLEHITGRRDGKLIHSIVTYKIADGKIAQVYFDFGH